MGGSGAGIHEIGVSQSEAANRMRLHSAHSTSANLEFWAKSRVLIARQLLLRAASGELFRRYQRMPVLPASARLLAHDEHRLYADCEPRERELELGKVQNLRIAAAAINGIVLQPSDTFSFWRAVGRPSRRNGYVAGRELRSGCMIPSVGGGICQLTNALSRVAHAAGMEIVERHSHTLHPPGFFIDSTTDATVFWNYVDLRFRSRTCVRIGAQLTETTLAVRLDAVP
jgi:vancomycin resistance protein VanW